PRDLAVVAAHPLLAGEDEVRGQGPYGGGQGPRGTQRVHGLEKRVLEMEGGGGAHGQTAAQRGLHALRAEGDEHDLPALLLLDTQRLLDGELVVGRDDPVELALRDPLAVGSDANSRFRVGHLLHADDDLQRRLPQGGNSLDITVAESSPPETPR